MKIVNSAQMVKIDQETQGRYGMPDLLLMENAGQKIYSHIQKHILQKNKHIVFLTGKGNNGGDALVIARQCAVDGNNAITVVLAAGEPASKSLAFMHLKICRGLQLDIIDYTKEQTKIHKILSAAAPLVSQ